MNQLLGKRLSWPIQIMLWILAFYIAWNIIDNGYEKLIQNPGVVTFFQSLGLPIWIMIATGIVETFGSILLFIPWVSFYAAIAVAVVMISATYYNGGSEWVTIISTIFAVIIAIFSRPRFLRKKIPITKIII